MKILITGGAGFIGSAVIRYLLNHTDNIVINLDSLTYAGNLESINMVANKSTYHFEQADIRDTEALHQIFTKYKPDAIMHLAAESHVDRSIDGPSAFIETNIIGTYNLLEASRKFWCTLPQSVKRNFRFHQVSTDEVYGDLEDTNDIFTESTPYAPSSPYSASKASADHLVRAWHRTYGLPVVLTNCSNNYGPFQFPEKLIPHIVLNALQGDPLPIYGDGTQIRDWLYVEDHARALSLVINKGTIGNTYNIGGNNELTNLNVVKSVCDLLEKLAPRKPAHVNNYQDLICFVKDRPGHDHRYAIDASKINIELNWAPQESFESGLRKTIEWYLSNNDWCKRILSGEYKLQRIGN